METKRWLAHYDEGVAHSLQPYPQCTLLDVMNDTLRQGAERTAFIFKGRQISYGELDRLSTALAAALHSLGVKKGDRVVLLLPNSPQTVIGQLGAWKAGAIVAPINPLYTGRELAEALNEIQAETVLVLTTFYEKFKAIQAETGVTRVIATNIKEYLPSLLRSLFTLAKEKKEGHRIQLQAGDYWLGDLIKAHANAALPPVTVGPQDPALLLFSGGTTGTPKAAMGSHQALLTTTLQFKAWADNCLVEWQDKGMMLMPAFHVYGNLTNLCTGLLCHYPMAIVPNPRDLDDLLATIRKERPAVMHAVPTLFIALLNHPDVRSGKVDLSSIKVCFSAAAPLMADTKRRFEEATGGRIIEAYGLTESMLAATVSPLYGAYKEGSVGVPLPDVEVRIGDIESGLGDLPPGEVGEIAIRAPQLMLGYWQRPAETSNMLRDGWLYTGDLGYMDEDGYLFIVDRKKDVIKPGGFQVWPREVEEVLASHPAVAEVGVAGIPDAYQGEAVKAWVVRREAQSLSEDELRLYCKERLAAYKVPKFIEFRDSLPKTTVGKVLRRELVKESST